MQRPDMQFFRDAWSFFWWALLWFVAWCATVGAAGWLLWKGVNRYGGVVFLVPPLIVLIGFSLAHARDQSEKRAIQRGDN